MRSSGCLGVKNCVFWDIFIIEKISKRRASFTFELLSPFHFKMSLLISFKNHHNALLSNLKEYYAQMIKSCSCEDKAIINATVKLHCQNCKAVSKRFSIKKPLRTAGIAVVFAYSGSQFIDYAITDNRYPLAEEYALLDACSSSHRRSFSRRDFAFKQKLCICALEDTMNEVSHVRYLVDKKEFSRAFENNIKSCKS